MRTTFLFILSVLAAPAMASEPAANARDRVPPATVPAPPPPPENHVPLAAPELPDGGQLEPEITITTRGTEIHEEYRLHGRLYAIKVIPARGRPYYLIDHEGSGHFRRSDIETRLSIPTWVIKRF